ncbi:hypothetical protein ISF_08322 [Cordyceps fumosorosea ARSEF 2679]|uniref:Fungal specific transcription factor n=1 Tax=Cordyceps fumosorosea (strain ARSEF 2679) TaxID=1081104 RepID=A0A167MID0_CORFA|nr:hypothetical protein ISF_08322 [Cordyceps fumosorosea ARSEF 2679]OAA54394.1 hypothetical protein ISF_08322 [Cordyceps fumosorosea ARSEF 2679]
MMKQPIGLASSIWAPLKQRSRDSSNPYAIYDSARSRSVPPPAPSTTTPATPNSTPLGTRTSTTLAAGLKPPQALQRFEQACQRLRWKYLDLEAAYERAIAPSAWAFTPDDAERNFKVDFYEFYAWIEQAIVLLLLVFAVTIPRERGSGGSRGGSSSHAYHHNVLRALDEEPNPLHDVLGRGDVNQALWKAKELRNRWKDAAEGRETPPLKMYDLAWIMGTVLRGLEEGYNLAKRTATVEEIIVDNPDDSGEGWDWMVEAMDWEA